MKKSLITLIFLCVSYFALAQSVTDATRISLLTGSPGSELYSTFGHSAFRIQDKKQNMDIVFNYGTFNFNTPNFYMKFVRGQLDYMLSVEQYENFEASFKYENRSVTEQELNLTNTQKSSLISLLFENYQPENRNYKYDFFFDNCATRIRDIMIKAYGDDFHYQYPDSWVNSKLTFRNLIDMYLTLHHWSDFGIDIALGLPTDGVATPADYMFLPDYLAEGFELATIDHDGEMVPLVKNTKILLARADIAPEVFVITPVRLMWTLFILSAVLSFFSYKKGLNIHWLDVSYFSIIGLLGWVVVFLWFFTDHIATKDNLNVLWAVPLHFPVFLFWPKIPIKIRMGYIWIFGILNLLILVLWVVFPQQYHVAFIPLILIILLRFYFLFKQSRGLSSSNSTTEL